MKVTFHKRPFILCCCATFCFAAAEARAQSQQQPVLLVLKAGPRELRVFDDGTAVESIRDSKTTLRRLSEGRMRKLREVIARHPCVRERPPASDVSLTTLSPKDIQEAVTAAEKDECRTMWRSFLARGMTEIQLTLRSPDGRSKTIPIYAVCDGAKEVDKEYVRRHYQSVLKPAWHRLVADASKVAGVRSFLKGCARLPY